MVHTLTLRWFFLSLLLYTLLIVVFLAFLLSLVLIDDAPKAVQAEKNVGTIISARSAQRATHRMRWLVEERSGGRSAVTETCEGR